MTRSTATETTPTLGADNASSLVVYTSLSGGVGQVFYQRVSDTRLLGSPVLVSEGGTNDQLNDVSGDYIVYTSYLSTTSRMGEVKLYEIASGMTTVLSQLTEIFEARVHDRKVAWVEGAAASTRVMLLDLDGLARGERPIEIAGPIPPASNLEIGANLVTWMERIDSLPDVHFDVTAYDMRSGARVTIAADPGLQEAFPSTSGSWVTWQAVVGNTGTPTTIEAYNVDTGERRTLGHAGAANLSPTIDGDLIAFESNASGNFEIYLYRISTGETFQVTSHPADQRLNNVFGNHVAYVDSRDGNQDVYVSAFALPPPDPLIAHYDFNGSADDISGKGNHGTLFGGSFTADWAGNASGALLLDGVDDYVLLPNEFRFDLSSFTILATLKVPDSSKENWILSKGPFFGNYTLRILADDHPFHPGKASYVHQIGGGNFSSLVSNRPVPLNRYFNMAVTIDAGGSRTYFDGALQLEIQPPYFAPPLLNNAPVTIGAGGYYSLSDFFSGAIDEVRIYNYALSSTEIRDLHDTPPLANAGPDQSGHAGTVVTLDGSQSTDPDGHYPLSYSWTLASKPTGSTAVLSKPTAVNPSFTADVPGGYTLDLIVADSLGLQSAPDTVSISTSNTKPVADAGPDLAVIVLDSTVQLNGSQSYDDDGDPLTYAWTVVQRPEGSSAVLSDSIAASPTFVVDTQGDYVIELVVSDPWSASDPDAITVSFTNVKPVANAGGNQAVLVGDTVVLYGGDSADANGDPLTYQWSLVSAPAGSSAALVDATAMLASFVADAAGTYVVSLVVHDGLAASDPANVTIVATTVQSETTNKLIDAITTINNLDPGVFKNSNLVNALTNKINSVLGLIEQGLYQEALDKLQNDILGKTDGCATTGSPDKNDWIIDCDEQAMVYPLVMEAIQLVGRLP
ncbi:MAG: PKD domain-containing protein [Nitrospirota bacterium]